MFGLTRRRRETRAPTLADDEILSEIDAFAASLSRPPSQEEAHVEAPEETSADDH